MILTFGKDKSNERIALNVLVNLSNIIITALIFYIVAYGIACGTPVYEEFIKGAKDGMKTVVQIMPTLIGLMMAVGILRASGFMEFVGGLLGGILGYVNFPAELVPVTFVKMFSSSAATGLVIDIFKEFGPDSYIGYATSLMMSSKSNIPRNRQTAAPGACTLRNARITIGDSSSPAVI